MFRIRPTTLVRAQRAVMQQPQAAMACRAASSQAISNPTLANIEKRWEGLPLQEQAELWMSLRDRMKENWKELTLQEKKAAYWIAFGPHGPRALPPPGESKKVALYTAIGIGASLLLFAGTRLFAGPAPPTMNREWQEAANEKLKEQKADPFTGIASKGYAGKGQIQSPPAAH